MRRRSGLVLIDMQLGLIEGDPPVADAAGLLQRVSTLLDRARQRGVPVFYVLDDDVGPVGSAAWDVHPALAPAAADVRIRKHACDAFHETDLRAALDAAGVGHLVVAGCKTELCVDTTCRAAISHGYPVTLVADGHSTTDAGPLSAAQVIAHHQRILNGFGAYCGAGICEIVATPAQLVAFDCAVDVPSSLERRPG